MKSADAIRAGEADEATMRWYIRFINPNIFRDIPVSAHTDSLYLTAVDANEQNLFYIPKEKWTRQLVEMAVDRNLDMIGVVPPNLMTIYLAYKVCSQKPYWLFHHDSIPVCQRLVDLLPGDLRAYTNLHAWNRTKPERLSDICKLYVHRDGMTLQFIKNPTIDECSQAFHQNPLSLQFIPGEKQKEMVDIIEPMIHARQDIWPYLDKSIRILLSTYLCDVMKVSSKMIDAMDGFIIPMLFRKKA